MKKVICSGVVFLLSVSPLWSQQVGWNWVSPYPTGQQINQVYFLNATAGFLLGDGGTLMRTTDGGETWQQLSVPQDAQFSSTILSIH